MAYADYLDLRNAIIQHTGRADLNDKLDELTKLAEARFNRDLRMSQQVTADTLTISSGSAPLPSDFAEMIGVFNLAGAEYVQQSVQYVMPNGRGGFYSITGGALTTTGGDGSRAIRYYATIPTITSGLDDTNWLLTRYPSLYFHGVCSELYKRAGDVQAAALHNEQYRADLADAQADDAGRRYGRARVRVSGPTP